METPESPFGVMAEFAITLHEHYRSMINAGFSEDQALTITIGFQRDAILAGKPEEE